MKQLEQVHIILQMPQGRDIVVAESRVAPVDDVLEVFSRYLSGRDVQRQDVVGKLGKGEVFPALPIRRSWNLFGDVEAAVGGETLEDDVFKRQLCKRNDSALKRLCVLISRARAHAHREAQKTKGRHHTSKSSPRVLKYRCEGE